MEKQEAIKIFYDIILEYKTLKYIFDYGFYWDDKITKYLMGKTSQKSRELYNILKDPVYKNCAYMYLNQLAKKQGKKSNRMLIRKNNYQLLQKTWILSIYELCGAYKDDTARRFLGECANKPYSECKDEGSTCAYKRICAFEEKRDMLLELIRGISKRDAISEGWKKLLSSYKDILDTNNSEGLKRLRRNHWTADMMVGENGVFTAEEYQYFLEMLAFLVNFTPLSAVGDSFLRHLNVSYQQLPAFVRNLPPNYGLEQEYIFRALFAIANNKSVLYEGKEYVPGRLVYMDKGLSGLDENLYLEAREMCRDGSKGEMCILPLYDGHYLAPGNRKCALSEEELIGGKNEQTQRFDVEFYTNRDTLYLQEKREKLWKQNIERSERLSEHKIFWSPYHPEGNMWEIDRVSYRILKRDIPGFLLFIRSFGDFAKCCFEEGDEAGKVEDNLSRRKKETPDRNKGRIKDEQTLLNVYASKEFIDQAKTALPPRKNELEWVLFVLEMYPNLCSAFIEKEKIQLLKERLILEIGTGNKELYKSRYCCKDRIKDIPAGTSAKYKKIFDAIRKHKVLQYEYQNERVEVFPYALEYDVCRHLEYNIREPINIMCYDLKEKRNIIILYKNIRTDKALMVNEFKFLNMDKLYHVLAYVIRCAAEDHEKIWDKADELLQKIWKVDKRGNNNYNRCVRKKFSKVDIKEYGELYMQLQNLVSSNPEEQRFVEKVFGYQQKKRSELMDDCGLSDSEDFRCKYETLLLKCFRDAVIQKNNIYAILETISDDEIWKLICGEPQNEIINEIAFFNEKFMNETVSFVLLDGTEENIERIYRLFGNYVCAGEMLSDGKLRFCVSYEKFDYRKIHMTLMALGDCIDNIEPIKTADIINKRKENQKG